MRLGDRADCNLCTHSFHRWVFTFRSLGADYWICGWLGGGGIGVHNRWSTDVSDVIDGFTGVVMHHSRCVLIALRAL